MDWLGSGDIRLRIGVTGDEGSSIGVRKKRKMCKNGKNKPTASFAYELGQLVI